jgi:general secretion pathway protein D
MIRLSHTSCLRAFSIFLSTLLIWFASGSRLLAQQDGVDELIPLILVDQDTNSIIELLEDLTGKYAIRAQNVPQVQINFKTKDDEGLTLEESILVIETLLSLNGVAITNLGSHEKFFRVLPAAGVNAQVPDFLDRDLIDGMPASQKVYSTYFDLDYLTVEQAMPKIQPFLTPGVGTTVIFEKANSFLITDALINIQRIKSLLNDIDKPSKNVELKFFTLAHMDATEMQQLLDRLAQGPLKAQLEGNTVMEADERTNQLMVLTHKSNLSIIEEIIKKLDVNVAAKTKSKVFSIKYADSKEVEALITQVINNQQSVRSKTEKKTGSSTARPTTTTKPAATPARNTNPNAGIGETNLQFSDYVIIVADERSNSIVASGTDSDLTYIEQLVNQIDVPLPQVRIEAIIAEVSLTKDMRRGIEAFQYNFNVNSVLDDGVTAIGDENFAMNLMTGTFTGRTGRYTLDFVYDASKANANVKVLSNPAILTTHNQEAIINISESRPIVTAVQSSGGLNVGGFVNSQVQYRDIGIQLKVKPLIGSNGAVQMEIEQKIEDIGETIEINGNPNPAIKKKEANSFVSVNDQEVIILGGLQSLRTANSHSTSGPLSLIPIVGNLFGSRQKEGNVSELIIFLKPHVITTATEGSTFTKEVIDSLTHKEDISNFTRDGAFETYRKISQEESKTVNRMREFFGKHKDFE